MTGDTGRPFIRRLALGVAFVRAALVYWLQVFPRVAGEVGRRRRRAGAIPDPGLRETALWVLRTKRDNLEGAAAFAAFAQRAGRARAIGAQVGLQGIYDYVDALSEQPHRDPVGNSRHLHQALRRALQPAEPHPDYYAMQAGRHDGEYLVALVQACRAALVGLPSHTYVIEAAERAVERIVAYQTFNVASPDKSDRLREWATVQASAGEDLRWWETAASAGSSLGLFALISLAADPETAPAEIPAIERAYFPWVGALHSLLDSLVDIREDTREGQRNLITLYASPREAALRLRMLTRESLGQVAQIAHAAPHQLILAGMVGSYLSEGEARRPNVRLASDAVIDVAGGLACVALRMHRLRRALRRCSRRQE